MLDLIIRNGQCYINGELKNVDVAIKDGKIQQIGQISDEAKEIVNAEGQTVLPGCIDTQTHFREPGSTDTEDLNSGSRAAMIQGQMIEDPAVHRRATEAKPVVRRTNLPRTRRKAMERAKPTGITGLLRADSSVRVEAND